MIRYTKLETNYSLQVLRQHDFPGNVRELENIIASAVLSETTDLLRPQNLPLHLTQESSQVTTGSPMDATTILPLDEVAAGGFMLAQALVVNADVQECTLQDDCGDKEQCDWTCLKWVWIPSEGFWTCRLEGMGCVAVN